MDKIFKLEFKNLDDEYIVEKTITLRFPEEKYEELRKIAIEIDDTIEEVINCIVDNDLIKRIDDKDFKQSVIDAYYSEMLDF
jgi:hypothetical protein